MLLSCYYEYRHNKATHALLVPHNEFQVNDVRFGGSYELIQKMTEIDDAIRHVLVGGISKTAAF
jgi:hypothetical protein